MAGKHIKLYSVYYEKSQRTIKKYPTMTQLLIASIMCIKIILLRIISNRGYVRITSQGNIQHVFTEQNAYISVLSN